MSREPDFQELQRLRALVDQVSEGPYELQSKDGCRIARGPEPDGYRHTFCKFPRHGSHNNSRLVFGLLKNAAYLLDAALEKKLNGTAVC